MPLPTHYTYIRKISTLHPLTQPAFVLKNVINLRLCIHYEHSVFKHPVVLMIEDGHHTWVQLRGIKYRILEAWRYLPSYELIPLPN